MIPFFSFVAEYKDAPEGHCVTPDGWTLCRRYIAPTYEPDESALVCHLCMAVVDDWVQSVSD